MMSHVAVQVHCHRGWVVRPWRVTQGHSVSAQVSTATSALQYVLSGTSGSCAMWARGGRLLCVPVCLCCLVPGPLWPACRTASQD